MEARVSLSALRKAASLAQEQKIQVMAEQQRLQMKADLIEEIEQGFRAAVVIEQAPTAQPQDPLPPEVAEAMARADAVTKGVQSDAPPVG